MMSLLLLFFFFSSSGSHSHLFICSGLNQLIMCSCEPKFSCTSVTGSIKLWKCINVNRDEQITHPPRFTSPCRGNCGIDFGVSGYYIVSFSTFVCVMLMCCCCCCCDRGNVSSLHNSPSCLWLTITQRHYNKPEPSSMLLVTPVLVLLWQVKMY